MNSRVLQDNEDSNYQHDVADHLSDGILQRPIEPALRKQPVKEKTFRPGGEPEDRHQQRDQQENLDEAQIDCWKRRGPGQRDPRRVYRGDGEEDDRRHT